MQVISTNRETTLLKQIKTLEEKYHSQKEMTEMTILHLQEVNEQLKIAKEEKEKFNKRITQSITYAQRIQQRILPSNDILYKTFPNYFLLYQPKDVVSGDFYWLHEDDQKKYLGIIDCTGHGVPGAFLTVLVNAILNAVIRENNNLTTEDILRELDYRLYNHLNRNSDFKRTQDGLEITLCAFNKKENSIQFTSTHQNIFHLTSNGLVEYKGIPYSIGEYSKRKERLSSTTIQYNNGEMLYLSTDGYLDQFGGEKNQKFKRKNFKTLLEKINPYPLEQQKKMIALIFDKWKSEKMQTDDILVMGIRL